MKKSSPSSSSSSSSSLFLFLIINILLLQLRVSHGADDLPEYGIDYRGPETHPSLAPPSHIRGRQWTRWRGAKEPPKSKKPRRASAGPKRDREDP